MALQLLLCASSGYGQPGRPAELASAGVVPGMPLRQVIASVPGIGGVAQQPFSGQLRVIENLPSGGIVWELSFRQDVLLFYTGSMISREVSETSYNAARLGFFDLLAKLSSWLGKPDAAQPPPEYESLPAPDGNQRQKVGRYEWTTGNTTASLQLERTKTATDTGLFLLVEVRPRPGP